MLDFLSQYTINSNEIWDQYSVILDLQLRLERLHRFPNEDFSEFQH